MMTVRGFGDSLFDNSSLGYEDLVQIPMLRRRAWNKFQRMDVFPNHS